MELAVELAQAGVLQQQEPAVEQALAAVLQQQVLVVAPVQVLQQLAQAAELAGKPAQAVWVLQA